MTKLVLLIFLFFSPMHDYYVGHTTIKYSTQTASVQITIKLFTDDLNTTLTAGEHAGLESYVRQHLTIILNGHKKAEDLFWIGTETENELTWIYLEIPQVKKIRQVEIENTLLTDVFKQQSNIVQIEVGNTTKGMLFDYKKTKQKVDF